jgi:hypothetical protein
LDHDALIKKSVEEQDAMLTELGRMVTTWNWLESQVRVVLTLLASASEEALLRGQNRMDEVTAARTRARVLTTHLGNVAITDAINALAKGQNALLAGHLTHLSKLFDRLREHRNFYAHGTKGAGSNVSLDGRMETSALATQVTAKGTLKVSSLRFGKSDLEVFVRQLGDAGRYSQMIQHAIINPNLPPEAYAGVFEHPSSLQKPPLPDRLLKSHQALIGEPPQPQS